VTATIRIAISVQKQLFDQAESLAQQLNISRSHLFSIALEFFINSYPNQALPDEISSDFEDRHDPNEPAGSPMRSEQKVIHQGDIYWVPLEEPDGFEPGFTHPHVVIQDNVLNRSRIDTVVVCALTTNMKRAKAPGNVLLDNGEANLPRQSVVVVSQVSTVDKTQLGEYIGSLSKQRVKQILAGLQFLQLMTGTRPAPG
jgi:mRNA interferase MazF